MKILTALVLTTLCMAPTVGAAATPAEQRIAQLRESIEREPARAEPYAELALALARRARETAEPQFYREAHAAIAASLARAPDNLEAERARVWVLLGQHEFAQALEAATALQRKMPDDLLAYAFLVDANVELGRYRDAEDAAQWLLDLRPGNVAGLTRAGYLRELFGDHEGAVDIMSDAYRRMPPAEVEERAWVLTQIAHLELLRGRPDAAAEIADEALRLFPDYHYALAQLAHARAQQGQLQDAVALMQKRYDLAPQPENLHALAEMQHRAGQRKAAHANFTRFEKLARAEMAGWDNANRELIFYYADRAGKPRQALAVATQEAARRQDVHTLDAYAWALHKNGRHADAARQMAQALAVGVREAPMLYRAAVINARLKRLPEARQQLQDLLTLAPRADVAPAARALQARLAQQ
jgi:tetratricopeptide (TPR) repeat protein